MLTGDPALAQTTLSLETVIARIHSEDRADVLRHVEKAEAEGGPVILTYRVHTAEGIRWVLDHGRIYAREAAMPAHGHGILIDVTARVLRDGRLEDPQAASSSPLDRAASHALAARRAIDEDGTPILRQLVDLLMWELGRAIARRIGGGHGNRLN
ncbi:hypothetical protein J2X36_003921 [Methylobacterium sp. BE186]|uniref:PAS domain-containing protein n=1 Tax=Methylobacterium sp. BE186 TaxID=2817715 RepID=UPI00285DC764|nr:PAS domain-containing protein [Methylobacterium sp. BE186]MDR7039148.1 hypothetical protein [Methylobacterium sp. BE186]